jgi:hypothetical protein
MLCATTDIEVGQASSSNVGGMTRADDDDAGGAGMEEWRA